MTLTDPPSKPPHSRSIDLGPCDACRAPLVLAPADLRPGPLTCPACGERYVLTMRLERPAEEREETQ